MTIKFYWIFIFLCVQFLIKSEAQSDLPDSLFRQGNYKYAALEYERIVSQESAPSILNELHCNRARCFKLLGEYSRALVELSKISYWNLPDSLNLKYRYETALCDYLAGSFNDAIFQLEQVKDSSIPKNTDRAMFSLIKAFCYNETMNWEKAQKEAESYVILTYSHPVSDSIQNLLASSYQKRHLPRIKSEKKANVYRMLPGLGQVYVGHPVEGICNFLLNAGFLSFGAYEIYHGFYVTGYFVGAIGLNKVYFGGHSRTAFLLAKHNYTQRKNFCEKIKSIIINKKAG